MSQLTIRGFDRHLERHLREVARDRGISLNKAALLVLSRGAGLDSESSVAKGIGTALDRFVGNWSEAEERELLDALEPLEQVDSELWR